MDKVLIYYHKESDTMYVWFGNPQDEYICEEFGEGVILKKGNRSREAVCNKIPWNKTTPPF